MPVSQSAHGQLFSVAQSRYRVFDPLRMKLLARMNNRIRLRLGFCSRAHKSLSRSSLVSFPLHSTKRSSPGNSKSGVYVRTLAGCVKGNFVVSYPNLIRFLRRRLATFLSNLDLYLLVTPSQHKNQTSESDTNEKINQHHSSFKSRAVSESR